MPNEVKQLEDGKVEVILESGEKFTGDALEVLNKMGDAHVSTKRWAQNIKSENESLKAQRLNPPEPPPVQQPVSTNADEAALQAYLLDQHAKALGYANAAEYQREVTQIKETTQLSRDSQIAESFVQSRPEFPSTPEAIEKLYERMNANQWAFDVPHLKAAHDDLIREGAYKPLPPEVVNSQWTNQMQQSSGRPVPPQPPQGNAPGGNDNVNPYSMNRDELAKKVLEGGGLAKALMDLKPGETFGG